MIDRSIDDDVPHITMHIELEKEEEEEKVDRDVEGGGVRRGGAGAAGAAEG